jgi:hypothetical protein
VSDRTTDQNTITPFPRSVVFAKSYDRRTALEAATMLIDRALPLFESRELSLLRILTDRDAEYSGPAEPYEYELHLAVEDIDPSKTKARHSQADDICERLYETSRRSSIRSPSAGGST